MYYDKNNVTSTSNQKEYRPPYRSRRILGWLKPVFNVSEAELLSFVGLDMFVMLRYIKLCINCALFSTFICLFFLVPSYQAGSGVSSACDDSKSEDNTKDSTYCQKEEFNKFTLQVCTKYLTLIYIILSF